MASRWFYKAFDQELGPVSFQDLAEMVRAGTLTEDDRVRREFSEDWTRARDVIGLFRAAKAGPPAATPAEPEPALGAGLPTAPEGQPEVRARRRSPDLAGRPTGGL